MPPYAGKGVARVSKLEKARGGNDDAEKQQ
jgi:hypothetical protein